MAKRRAAAATVINTGIYRRIQPAPVTGKAIPNAIEAKARQVADDFDVERLLARIDERVAAILNPYRSKTSALPWMLGADWETGLTDHVRETVRDAQSLAVHCHALRDMLELGDSQSAVIHALHVGRLADRLDVRPFEPYVKQVRDNTRRLREPQDTRRLANLGRVVLAIPSVDWRKMESGVAKLHDATGIPERSLWRHLGTLRAADVPLIESLAEATTLTAQQVRQLIKQIPLGKKSTATR